MDWITADEEYDYYVDGSQGQGLHNGYSKSAAALVVETLMKIKDDVDFKEFDGNDDQTVDMVILVGVNLASNN